MSLLTPDLGCPLSFLRTSVAPGLVSATEKAGARRAEPAPARASAWLLLGPPWGWALAPPLSPVITGLPGLAAAQTLPSLWALPGAWVPDLIV